ncbi:MAG: GDSL family lipase, partial [Verrucomicrobiae bacterium]|nr:GDSL family lipase [Verrucomicrobiae bacterium]
TKIPGARVLVMGIFPRGSQPTHPKTGKPTPTRQRIADTNALLAKLADGKNVVFLDISDKFLDADGVLPKAIFPDALHPSSEGYQIWYRNAQPKLAELMKAP